MTSLTETAYYTRRSINWVILAIIAYIIIRILFSIFVTIFLIIFPPKAPPPNHAFSVLPALKFPATASPAGQLTYRLETIQGSLPKASESANVYFMPKTPANLLALTKTEDFAKRLEFNPTPIQETKNIYRFDDAELPLRKLRYDIVSNNFILRYGFEQDTGLFLEKNLPLEPAARAEATSLIQTYDLYPDDLAGGSSVVSFLKLSSGKLIMTTSLSQADAVRVDFFRRPVGNAPVFTPFPGEGQSTIIYSGSANSKKHMLEWAYTFWPIDYGTIGTYGLKTTSQAWQELQSGGGYIAQYPTTGTNVVVRNIYIGYYDSFEPQTYLQPIFVFEGDGGFLAYVPAVAPPWTE